MEFRPGDAPIHHAVLHLDRTPASRERTAATVSPASTAWAAIGTQEPDGHFVGWAPGAVRSCLRRAVPWRLARGTDLVLELHLIPRRSAVVRAADGRAVLRGCVRGRDARSCSRWDRRRIDIPAGATDYAITRSLRAARRTSTLLSLYPHAHFLGKDMQVQATLPDGTTRTLLHIPRWSFHWQQDYRFATPVALPRGTTIAMRFTYDNSDANHDNPHHPPVRVMAGPAIDGRDGQPAAAARAGLVRRRSRSARADVAAREAAANVASAEQLVRDQPGRAPENLTFLGASYVDVGRDRRRHRGTDTRGPARSADRGRRTTRWAARCSRRAGSPEAVRELQQAARLQSAGRVRAVQPRQGARSRRAGVDAGRAALTRALALESGLRRGARRAGRAALFARGRLTRGDRALRRPSSSRRTRRSHTAISAARSRRPAGVTRRSCTSARRSTLDPENAAARENLARLQRGR